MSGMMRARQRLAPPSTPLTVHLQQDDADLEALQRLTAARHATPALRRGELRFTHAEGEGLVYARELGEQVAYVALNTAQAEARLPLTGVRPGLYRDALSGQTFDLQGDTELDVPARGGVVLVPA